MKSWKRMIGEELFGFADAALNEALDMLDTTISEAAGIDTSKNHRKDQSRRHRSGKR